MNRCNYLLFLGIIVHRLINVTITKPTKRQAMIVVKVSQRPPAPVTTTTNCTVTAIIISRETVAQEVRKESQKTCTWNYVCKRDFCPLPACTCICIWNKICKKSKVHKLLLLQYSAYTKHWI